MHAMQWLLPRPVSPPACRWQRWSRGWRTFAGVKGRLQRRAGNKGAEMLDDTYNANPDSVRAGIDVLAATIGRKLLVLGRHGRNRRRQRSVSR
jgi:UDP-N-acetylmuramyl pentapeptide synthase